MYDSIIDCLKKSGNPVFNRTGSQKHTNMPGWREHVADLYKASRDIRETWLCARPKQGTLFDLHKNAKARCKYAIRLIKINEQRMRRESLARNCPAKIWALSGRKSNI